MKKFGFLLLMLLVFVWTWPSEGQAASAGGSILLDGKNISSGLDVPVENVNGNVMVPLRLISQNMGYAVDWQQQSKSITVQGRGKTLKLAVGQKTASADGVTITLQTAPILKQNTSLVPIRFIGEQLGLTVGWDNTSKTVSLITQAAAPGNASPQPGNGGSSGGGGGTAVQPNVPSSELTKVNGISFSENRLMIALEGAAEPQTSVLHNPERIVIDLPNATFSDSFGTGHTLSPDLAGNLEVTDYPDVSNVRYSLFSTSPYTVRFVIDLNHEKGYQVAVTGDSSSKLIIVDLNVEAPLPSATPAPTPVPAPSSTPVLPGGTGKKLIVLDAGHGAKDSGAVGVTGKYEKKFNLSIVLKTAELLKKEPDLQVVLTRSDDTFLELKERAAIANNLKADLFISVHANSGSAKATGTETYYQRDASKAFANVMHKHLVKATGLSDRGVRYGNFHVIRETKMPAILLEAGYLSNKGDEALLFTEELQDRFAQAIVDGIKEYLGIK